MSIVFKRTLKIYFFTALSALSLLSLTFMNSAVVEASEPRLTAQENASISHPLVGEIIADNISETSSLDIQFGNYVYQAQEGDNLTYFARKSIQLFLDYDPNVQLDTSQIIAAETHIVKSLGDFELEVDQRVEIDISLVGENVYRASLLDDISKNCWAAYAPIRESLDFIKPLSVPFSIAETLPEFAIDDLDIANDGISLDSETEVEVKNAVAKNDLAFYSTILGILVSVTIIGWILVWSVTQDNKQDQKEKDIKSNKEDKPAGKIKTSHSKIKKELKTLPSALSKQKDRLKDSKLVKKKKPKKKK